MTDRTLYDLGYEPLQTGATHSAGVSTRAWAAAGWTPTVNPDGTPRPMKFRNLLTVELRYQSARHLDRFSKQARRLSAALVELLASNEPRPLVRLMPTCTQVVYRVETLNFVPLLPAFPHGIQTRDERAVLALQLTSGAVPVDDSATWLEDRSPLSVARLDLPEWSAEQTSRAVHGLIEAWVAKGDLRVCGPYRG